MLAQDLLCSPLAFDGGAAAIVALGCPSSQGCDVISETFRSLCGVELPKTDVAEPNLRIYVLVLDPSAFFAGRYRDSSCRPVDFVRISCRVSSSGR